MLVITGPRCTVTLSWACSRTRQTQTLSEGAVVRMEERDGPTCLRRKRLFGIPDEALPRQAQ